MKHESAIKPDGPVAMQLLGDIVSFSAVAAGGETVSVADSIAAVRKLFGDGKVTEQKLEQAIAGTEDVIMPLLRSLPQRAVLEVSGAELAEVLRLLSVQAGVAVPTASVEHLFNLLADHACGSPVAWRQPVPAAHVALGLTVLREVLHHGGFDAVSLSSPAL
ncbi:MAG: hypothetical protein KF778_13660 [Rhodocyclaceae bacterium]|nr:hypothetical protein [Rhodocyclaceae bacterium]MBX3669443.1 hypothetical protein [Rhodocyclaceae bacterium]